MKTYSYAVLGAGRQGTAAAYDMGKWGDAGSVLLADANLDSAARAAQSINKLLGMEIVYAQQLDVTDDQAVQRMITGMDACLSAVPYFYNLKISAAAVQAKVNICDLGGHVDIARGQHLLNEKALAANISVIPNCGQVPGLGTTLMVRAIELLDEAEHVYMWDGGLPQNPHPPFHYLLTFHMEGLTNEYAEPPVFLRNGKVTRIEPMSELEEIEFPPPIGRLEAFAAGGGTDTMPWTYEGQLQTLQNKTLRHRGHFAPLRAFYDLGLWRTDPILIHDHEVVPREVFNALFEPLVTFEGEKDLVIIRVKATGKKDGKPAESLVEVIDYFDDNTGFSAMQRCTGWSAAIVAEMSARGDTRKGAGGVEFMVPPSLFVEELRKRGIQVIEFVTSVSGGHL